MPATSSSRWRNPPLCSLRPRAWASSPPGSFIGIGLPLLLLFQMAMFVIAGNLFRRVQPAHEGLQTGRRREPLGVASGFATVWRLPGLRALMAVVSITGFFGFGAYLVAIPLLVRETDHGGAGLFSAVQLCFTLGVLSANLRLHAPRRIPGCPGRALIASLFGRGIVLAVLALHLPWRALFPAVVVLGMFSGMAITLGRVLTHTQAPDSHRSRVVSIYQLAFFGTAPLGVADGADDRRIWRAAGAGRAGRLHHRVRARNPYAGVASRLRKAMSAAVTATLSDSTSLAMGMRTRRWASADTAADTPSVSLPST